MGASTLASADKQIAPAQKLKDELEAVGRAISHDLQAPLRNILSMCDALGHHPAVAGTPAMHDAVSELAHEAANMRAMMQAMLEYVRLETFNTPMSLLDANELVEDAITALGAE